VSPPKDGWSYEPQGLTDLEFEPLRVDMEAFDFHDRIKRFDVNRPGTFGTITSHRIHGNTQIKVMDFQQGELVASVVTPKELLVLDIDDSGQRLVVVSDKFGFGEKREIGTYLINDSVLTEESLFVPFPDLRTPDLDVVSANFVGDHHMLVLSHSGRVSVWNLETLREECGFDLKSRAQVACGPDPNVIAFADNEQFGLFDIRRQQFLGVAQIPEGMQSLKIAISPTGARLVLAGSEKGVVINTPDGQVQEEIPFSGTSVQRVEFATDDFLLISSQSLYSISNRMLLWTYGGADQSASVGGKTFLLRADSSAEGSVIPATLPDPQARAALEAAHAQPELFVVRPGVAVQIDVTRVPQQYRQIVQKSLTKELQNRDLTVTEQADVVLAAGITGPQQKVVEYGRFGLTRGGSGYVISEYVSTLEILWKGQTAWTKKRTNAPGSVSARKGQSIKDALREKTSQPNLRIFEVAGFPRYVRKPNGKSAKSRHALGQSSIDGLSP